MMAGENNGHYQIRGSVGGSVLICAHEGEHGSYLRWNVGPNRMFGTAENTPETRQFLRKVLERLEMEAEKT